MQPESSMDPGEISIQKLKEACEMVTITKQRRHIFLETKRTLKRGFTSSKVRLSGLRPGSFIPYNTHSIPKSSNTYYQSQMFQVDRYSCHQQENSCSSDNNFQEELRSAPRSTVYRPRGNCINKVHYFFPFLDWYK